MFKRAMVTCGVHAGWNILECCVLCFGATWPGLLGDHTALTGLGGRIVFCSVIHLEFSVVPG